MPWKKILKRNTNAVREKDVLSNGPLLSNARGANFRFPSVSLLDFASGPTGDEMED
jgi:hypothetical protein